MTNNVRSVSPVERSLHLLARAADAGIDWTSSEDLWSRINEELAEVKAAQDDVGTLSARIAVRESRNGNTPGASGKNAAHKLLMEELGELMFAVIDLCRVFNVDPQTALESANNKFEQCCAYIEEKTSEEGLLLALVDASYIRQLWNEAKNSRHIAESLKQNKNAPSIQKASYGTA